MLDADPITLIKAAQDAAQSEGQNLAQQLARSETFCNELRGKIMHAQGKYDACTAFLKTLEPSAPLITTETELPNATQHDPPAPVT